MCDCAIPEVQITEECHTVCALDHEAQPCLMRPPHTWSWYDAVNNSRPRRPSWCCWLTSLILKHSFYRNVSEITRPSLPFCLGPHFGCLSPPKTSTFTHPTYVPYRTGPWCFVQMGWVKKKKRNVSPCQDCLLIKHNILSRA